MIDDLEFDALVSECEACAEIEFVHPCWRCFTERKRTSRAVELWDELARQREAQMTDERTTRLVRMLNIANRLTELHVDVTNMVLHCGDDAELMLLQRRLAKAELVASDLYQRELEVANG